MKPTLTLLAALLPAPPATLHAAGPAEQAPPIGSAAPRLPPGADFIEEINFWGDPNLPMKCY